MQLFIADTITIFFLMDAIGTIPVFLALTKDNSAAKRMRIAFNASLIAGVIVLGFALFGQTILEHFGLSIGALQVGGGLLLLYIAFEMIFAGQAIYDNATDTRSVTVSPLAIPMLAGPGSMSFAMIAFVGSSGTGRISVVMAIAAATALGAILLALSSVISKLLGREVIRALEKITAILLAIIASQMIMTGIKSFF